MKHKVVRLLIKMESNLVVVVVILLGGAHRRRLPPNIPDTASMMMGAARLPKMAPIPLPVRRRRLIRFLVVIRFNLPAPNVLRPLPLG